MNRQISQSTILLGFGIASSRLSFAASSCKQEIGKKKSDMGLAFWVSGMLETAGDWIQSQHGCSSNRHGRSAGGGAEAAEEPAKSEAEEPTCAPAALPQGLLAQKIAALSVLAAASAIGAIECQPSDLCPVVPPLWLPLWELRGAAAMTSAAGVVSALGRACFSTPKAFFSSVRLFAEYEEFFFFFFESNISIWIPCRLCSEPCMRTSVTCFV